MLLRCFFALEISLGVANVRRHLPVGPTRISRRPVPVLAGDSRRPAVGRPSHETAARLLDAVRQVSGTRPRQSMPPAVLEKVRLTDGTRAPSN